MQSVDIETGELVSVPLEIEYIKSSGKSNPLQPTEIRLVNTPIMLEDMHKITKIHLRDKKYNEVIIERNNYMIQGEKGSVSVFTKASSLVEKPEFTNKSVSTLTNEMKLNKYINFINMERGFGNIFGYANEKFKQIKGNRSWFHP